MIAARARPSRLGCPVRPRRTESSAAVSTRRGHEQLRGQLAGQPARRRTRGSEANRPPSGRSALAVRAAVDQLASAIRHGSQVTARACVRGCEKADPRTSRTCSRNRPRLRHGTPQWTRRQLPLPGDLGAAAARVRGDRAGPGDDPRGGYDFDEFRDELERRIAGVPMFHRKLKQVPLGIDHPVWVIDDDFDIDRHVHRMALPSPGGDRELADLCGHIAGIPLDRSRPLWEFFVIEGLESGKVAVFTKMHHSHRRRGLGRQRDLLPVQPRAGRAAARERPEGPAPAAYAARHRAARPGRRHQPGQAGRRWPSWSAPTADVLTKTIGRARSGTAMAAPLTAPRTSFNGTITGHRTIALEDMSLDEDQGDQERRRRARPSTTW